MPAWFMKPATAVVPARGELPYPPETSEFCHEVELVVAIGRGGRDIDPAQAESQHIWGYAVGPDLTRRDLQQQAKRVGGPWEPAKAFNHSAPCSALVPAATCGHPREGAIQLAVNGVERQRADLSGLLWPAPELVAMLSRSVALMPGDLIFTGTPVGVEALAARRCHPGQRGGHRRASADRRPLKATRHTIYRRPLERTPQDRPRHRRRQRRRPPHGHRPAQ